MTVQEVLNVMSEKGLRITEQRKTLAELFVNTTSQLTAKQVHSFLSQTYSGLSFDTVYRNLRVLTEMNVLEQFVFEDGMKFKLHCSSEEHHHHLICLQCEKTFPLHYCPMEEVKHLSHDFEPVKHKFEVFGYCKDCK
ncbi:Fur family transcriptional regulator [Longirhabdus pacifica]|uniref:Fur family transcriptional regulator n=1 Tax=Longirhabdus pacifica TaxID=2305227 RepID=UPI001008C322|nr:Fur family transcriptional regulator [Longirhabdus pacifica]